MTRASWRAGASLVALLAALAFPPSAGACGSANCLLSARSDSGALRPGGFRLDFSFRYMDQDRRMFGDSVLRVPGVTGPTVLRPRVDYERGALEPGYHQEFGARSRFLQADLSYGLGERLTAVVSLPFQARRRTEHMFFPGQAPASHAHSTTTPSRQTFTTSGIGDAQLSLRYRAGGGFLLGAAVQLPTGPTGLLDEYGQVADPMHQPGTGALGAILSASTAGRWGRIGSNWSASASFQRNAANERGYRFGDELIVISGLARPLSRGLSATVQLKGQYVARNRFHGQASTSTGGTVLSAAPGFSWRGPGGTALYAALQVPVYQYVNEGQLAARAIVTTGVSLTR